MQEYVFNEVKRVGEINFDFAEKSSPINYTQKLASKMQLFEDDLVQDIIKHQYLLEELDSKRI